MNINKIILALVVVTIISFSVAVLIFYLTDYDGSVYECPPQELQTESHLINLSDAESVRTEIKMGVGTLNISGGADELLESNISYNVASLKPGIEYTVNDGLGQLIIQQPKNRGTPMGNIINEWDLRLNNNVPMDMNIDLGVGEADIELSNLNLTSLNIDMGVGDVTLDLSGSRSLTNLDIEMGVGEALVDLTSIRENDLNATIEGGIGDLTLRLPGDVGVRVDVEKGIGDIKANNLYVDGNTYFNNIYGKTNVTLSFDIDIGVGEIKLE